MTFPRIFLATSLFLFGAIGFAVVVKKKKPISVEGQNNGPVVVSTMPVSASTTTLAPIEIQLGSLQQAQPLSTANSLGVVEQLPLEKSEDVAQCIVDSACVDGTKSAPIKPFIQVDHIDLLFKKPSPLPIVETIEYKSRAPWKRSRSAWLVDYASHYKTHLHFIARSLNGKPDYTPKAAREGERFNVLSQSQNFYFYLLVDLSQCTLSFYYVCPNENDPKENEYGLLKTYRVGLGRPDSTKTSGYLTPTGRYRLGSRTAVFNPKMMGNHKGQKVELIQVFGTRWIPFEKEMGVCSEPAKSYGIHGTAWQPSVPGGPLVDNLSSIGKYESDGCVRLASADMEELFAIIASHETIIEIVPNESFVKMTGKEKLF